MSPFIDRDLVIHAVVATGVCVAAWMFVVKPQQEQLKALKATIAESQEQSQASIRPSREALDEQVQKMNQRVSEIRALNAFTSDSSQIYGRVMRLADRHRVQIQGMQPDNTSIASVDGLVNTARIKITVDGTYHNVAQFMEAVSELSPFVRPNAVQISPTVVDNQPMIAASFVLDALSFKIIDTLASIGAPANGQP